MKNLKQTTSALLSVLILSSASISFADGGDSGPMGERGDNSDKADVNLPCPESFLPGKWTCEAGKWLASKLPPKPEVRDVPVEQLQIPTTQIANEIPVLQLERDRNGVCLSLNKNEVYYPLFTTPDEKIQAMTYINDDVKSITVNISQETVIALRSARRAGIAMQDWPFVLHGPLKFCGSVDLQLSAETRDLSHPWDRLIIGPNVRIDGQNGNNVSIVSSQIRNIELIGNCDPKARLTSTITTCIRFQRDLRTSDRGYLFVQHLGKYTCRVDQMNISDVEKNTVGYTHRNPIPCDLLPKISSPVVTDINVAISQPAPSTTATTTTVVTGPVVRSSLICDGPYYAPIIATAVAPAFGLSKPAPAAAATDPVVSQPVPEVVQEHAKSKKLKSKKAVATTTVADRSHAER